jgi:hypothetical protein
LKNSAALPPSERPAVLGELAAVISALCALAALAVWWFYTRGYILYYGDAQAHLNISRSIIDSHTPGYEQIGTVWLPLLHVICLPWVPNNWLWSTGLAGSIPVSICFVAAGTCFYFAARQTYESSLAAAVVLCCLVLNPNILYLASIPMTEIVFLAGVAVMLLSLLRFQATQEKVWIAVAVLASWAMSLTRYDGWFLIPFTAIWFAAFARNHRRTVLISFGVVASLAPLYWLAHCWWETSNALDFYNGPYSAKAIQGGKPYPGYHDWRLSFLYYAAAGELCSGWGLTLLGIVGIACAAARRAISKIGILFLTPLFYIWSLHSSGTPIFVPTLYPHGYYNSRYGIAVVALAAFAAGAIVTRRKLAVIVPLISVLPWLVHPGVENWICWKESQVNSVARRAWTEAAAHYFQTNYQPGQGILAPFGDVTGIFCKAGIPVAEVLHEGNGPAWFANTTRPDLIHQESIAVAQEGTKLSGKLQENAPVYRLVDRIQVPDAPALQIFKRIP